MVQVNPEQPEEKLWEIGPVRDTQIADPTRGFLPGKAVTVKLYDNSQFVVEVPRDQFTAATVLKLINEQIQHEIGIRLLTGPPKSEIFGP